MKHLMHLTGALLALTAPAAAQWSDNFDGYASGTLLDNVGGWFGWDNSPAAAGTAVNTFARSAPNSMHCAAGTTDAVHPALGLTSGKWRFTAWQYIPSPLAGDIYFILNNVYNHGGPYQWTVELQADVTTGTVGDDFRPHTKQPLVLDQWVEYRVEIDLDNNTVAQFYNDCLISTGVYNVRGGPVALENIDLFSNGGECYWDDVSVEQIWADDFDSYPTGTLLDNVGGWAGWDNSPAAAGTAVATFALSAPNSMHCAAGATDAVHPGLGKTSGKWTLTAWQYIPSPLAGDIYFILNNVYNHGGPYQWSVELQADVTTGTVGDDFRPHTKLPLRLDQWVEYRVVMDLDANTVDQYYGGALVASGVYNVRGGPIALENIDLFSNGGECYWDNIVLERTPPALVNTYGKGCAGSSGRVPAIGATGLPISGGGGFSVDLSAAAPGAPAVLLFSVECATSAIAGCTIYVQLPAAGIPSSASATGTASVPMPIPGVVPLGLDGHLQWAVLDPGGAFLGLGALSDGMRIQVGL